MTKKGYKQTDEHKRNVSLSRIGIKLTEEHKKKISATRRKLLKEGKLKHPTKGKHHSQETRLKISEAHRGNSFSDEHRRRISEGRKGIKPSEETKRKRGLAISIAIKDKGIWNKGLTKETDERIKNISEKLKNKKYPKEMYPDRGWRKIRKYQIFPQQDTSIEIKIQKFLSLLHIEFYTHKYISDITHAYQCDIFIPSTKTIIEADGCYWHGCKICNKNSGGLNIYQEEQIKEDEIRTKELIEKGYRVIRLWEHEIKNITISKLKEILK